MPTTFANTIDGNDIYAKRAECDAAGNDLSTTYATKSELPDGVPAVTSSDNNKVLKASYSGGTGSYSWQTESGGGGGGGSYTAGTGIDITNDVISVDTSVVATQTDLADKEDAFDVGTGLEMDTSGATPTLQVEAPVDIVAGPGIVIDNPDGNTLRVSTEADAETVLWSGNGISGTTMNLSETVKNFDRIRFYGHESNRGRGCVYEVNPNITFNSNTLNFAISMADGEPGVSRTWVGMCYAFLSYTDTNATSITSKGGAQIFYWLDTGWDNATNRYIIVDKIVGIHRIAGGN